ncbi:hypothetical protein [Streptomyces sp. RK9]|uniref:hypothetical protein n=1 Tax=Streptomyces sp. RK9 TaxID=3239284 RepID=UPI00386FF539
MSETTPNQKGPAPAQYKPAATEPVPVPASEVKSEDIGKLSLEYRDGQPVIIVNDGPAIPAGLSVVDPSGTAIAGYAATQTRNQYGSFHTGDSYIVLNTYKPRPDSEK